MVIPDYFPIVYTVSNTVDPFIGNVIGKLQIWEQQKSFIYDHDWFVLVEHYFYKPI